MKVAIVGFGFMGQTHAGSLLNIPDTEITGVVDLNDPVEQLKSIKGNNDAVTITVEQAQKLPWYKSWDELVSKAGVPDAAIVALPTRFHCSAVVTALESGCHVMVEKPFATSVDECKKMIAAAEKAGKLLSVGYVVRCFAEYNALKGALHKADFGKLTFLEMRRFAGIPGWGCWLDPEVVRHSGGTLFDLLSHDLDFALHMLGTPAEIKATRRGKKDFKGDWLSVELDYKDFNVLIESAFVPPVSPYYQELVNFVNAVRSGDHTGVCTGKEALVTIEHCAKIRQILGEEQ